MSWDKDRVRQNLSMGETFLGVTNWLWAEFHLWICFVWLLYFQFECFRGGIFLSAHRSLLPYRWLSSLISLTCLPLISICVGSYLLDHCSYLPYYQGFSCPGASWPRLFYAHFLLLLCPELSCWDCWGSELSSLYCSLEILAVTLNCIW